MTDLFGLLFALVMLAAFAVIGRRSGRGENK